MSETIAPPPDQSTPPATPAQPFLGGAAPAPVQPTGEAPKNFLSEAFHKDGKLNEGWTKSFEERGLTRLASDAAKYGTEEDFWKAMDNKIGLVGRKSAVGYPDETWHPNDVAQFRQSAGIPETPDAYELKPKDIPKGVSWGDEDSKAYSEIMHKHNVPKAAAQELMQTYIKQAEAQSNGAIAAFDQQLTDLAGQSEAKFKKEWGPDYDSRLEQNISFARTKFTEQEMNDPIIKAALSHPKIVELLDAERRNLRGGAPPGLGQEGQAGTHSPYQQAAALMAEKDYSHNREKQVKAKQLMDLHAQQEARKTGRR